MKQAFIDGLKKYFEVVFDEIREITEGKQTMCDANRMLLQTHFYIEIINSS